MTDLSLSLANLPSPLAVENIDYATILSELVTDFSSRMPSYTAFLDSDPAIILMQVAAARELILRQRINDTFQSTLLAFAGGADLDQLAIFYGAVRETTEIDTLFKRRIINKIQGSSAAGSAYWYRYHALSSDSRVKDVAVTSPMPGVVQITVLSIEGDGVPSPSLLTTVASKVGADDVKVLTDTLQVSPAIKRTIYVSAVITLNPGVPSQVFSEIEANFRAAWIAAMGLGQPLTISWILTNLSPIGVQGVQLITPTGNTITTPNEFAVLGLLTLVSPSLLLYQGSILTISNVQATLTNQPLNARITVQAAIAGVLSSV